MNEMLLPPSLQAIKALSPVELIGSNPVYMIANAEDIRLAFFRMKLCRNHEQYSALNNLMLQQRRNLVLCLTKTVVQRVLKGLHEIVSIMTTAEAVESLRPLIASRHLVEGVYIVEPHMYGDTVGLTFNNAQACAAILDLQPVAKLFATLPIPVDNARKPAPWWRGEQPISFDADAAVCQLRFPLLILDNVRSSDNIGAISRTAFSLGVQSILVTDVTFSAINCRAMRTSMGALAFFSVMHTHDLVHSIRDLQEIGVDVLAASPRGESVIAPRSSRNWALVLGNEEQGSSTEVLEACSERIAIPQTAGDSLSVSVACGICLFELLKLTLGDRRAPDSA